MSPSLLPHFLDFAFHIFSLYLRLPQAVKYLPTVVHLQEFIAFNEKHYKHKMFPLEGYDMDYLLASPSAPNIAICFIVVNLTVICFKRETGREKEHKTCC